MAHSCQGSTWTVHLLNSATHNFFTQSGIAGDLHHPKLQFIAAFPSWKGNWKVIPHFLQTILLLQEHGNMDLSHCCPCSLGGGWYSFHGLDWVAPGACKRENHQPPLHTGIVISFLKKCLKYSYPLCSLSLDLMTFNISATISCRTEQESSIMLSKHDANRTHLFISVH